MKKILFTLIMLITLSGCSNDELQLAKDVFDTGKNIMNQDGGSSSDSDISNEVKAKLEEENLASKQVEACNLSGGREANTVVDIGVGDREYYAATNENAQLVEVYAPELIIQNDKKEEVTSSGRYCRDEADVDGTEAADLDQGHIIADSLGGASNAYNITPQDSNLNRHGQQSDMEGEIRDALHAGKKVTEFSSLITYPNNRTQTPDHYEYTFKIDGKNHAYSFDNK